MGVLGVQGLGRWVGVEGWREGIEEQVEVKVEVEVEERKLFSVGSNLGPMASLSSNYCAHNSAHYRVWFELPRVCTTETKSLGWFGSIPWLQ